MNSTKLCLILISLMIIPVTQAFGHGLGIDTTTSLNYEEKKILISVEMLPVYFDESENKKIRIYVYDKKTEEGISNVTFLLDIYKNNEKIFHDSLFAPNGEFIIDVDEYDYLTPYFKSGGLYHYEIDVISIDDPNNVVDFLSGYVADVSVVDTTYHKFKNSKNIDTTFRHKSYYDVISNFAYESSQKTITFEMPFDWEEKNISHLQVVHEEIFFPKELVELISPSYKAQVNGMDVFKSNLQIDDYSDEDGRIVHFILLQDHVKFFKNMIKKELLKQAMEPLPNKMYFQLSPDKELIFPISVLTTNGAYQIDLSWEPREIIPGLETKFIYTIRDGASLDLQYNTDFDFIVSKDAKQIHKSSEHARIGGGSVDFVFSADGTYTIIFDKIRGSEFFTSFTIVVGSSDENETAIPDWIKNNAGWWAEGQIDDGSFVSGIQWLISNGIMSIPPTEQGAGSDDAIPSWIKNNAGWWADGQIDDNSFVSGLQWLISNGIMKLTQETAEPKPEVKSVDLTISSSPILEKYFAKYVDVFGVPVYATSDVPDDKVLHAAQILAQYLDNDADGTPDNPLVVEKLKETNSAIPLFANEWEDETSKIWDDFSDVELNCWIALYADETNPRYGFDASLEEILHVITQCGYANAYPEIFAEKEGSALSNAMTNAIESRHYNPFVDEMMPFGDQHTEYIYWAMTSILGGQEDRLDEIDHEWKLNTKEKVMETDPDIYNLLTDPQYKLPTIIPDGNYQG